MGVGISVLMGLKSGSLMMVFLYLRSLGVGVGVGLGLVFLYASLVSLLVAAASHPAVDLPMLLGKKTDGSFPVWSLIIFSPYLYFVRAFSALRRLATREAPYTELLPGLYVGGWPSSPTKMPPGTPAVIDCTCELPRLLFTSASYLCLPTWDTRAPHPAAIDSAVRWACRKRAHNNNIPIFVHCAYGHGRSVAVMCALLVALGVVDHWKNAEKLIRDKRPCIRMNALHRNALEEWSKNRLSPPKTPRH